jgi:hypothetical protein
MLDCGGGAAVVVDRDERDDDSDCGIRGDERKAPSLRCVERVGCNDLKTRKCHYKLRSIQAVDRTTGCRADGHVR